MLSIRIIAKRQLSNAKNTYHQIRHLAAQAEAKKQETNSDLIKDVKFKLPAALPKKPKREPFAKNLYLGNFDYFFLTYPEPQHVDRYNEFEEFFKPIEAYLKSLDPKEFERNNAIPLHVIQQLREFGVLGARVHEDYKGLNLLESEFVRLLEAASTVPALGLFLYKQGVPAVDLLKKFGTMDQKFKYLTKIAAGYCIPTVAITEADSGPSTKKLDTIGLLTDDDKHWIVSGEKVFVANANLADMFIVFGHAMCSGDLDKRPETLSAFLIDKKAEGVTVQNDQIQTVGLKGFSMGKVTFKNVSIPKENILGEIGDGGKQLVENFTNTRHFIGAITIAILKNLLKHITKDVIHRKFLDGMVYETDSAQHIISNMIHSIYGMESVLYFTTSMMDLLQDQDIQLETALVEQFCVQECLKAVQNGMWLIGPRASTLLHPYEQIIRDAFTVTNYETSLIDTKIYSGLLAMQHYGTNFSVDIKKLRNPLQYPKFALLKAFFGDKKLNLHMEEYLHPSLQECADFLDRCLYDLKEVTQTLLVREGVNVGKKHNDLHRLSEMAALILVYVANIGRASRSYCIGNKNSESEIKMAVTMSYYFQKQVNSLADEIKMGEFINGDYNGKELTQLHFQTKDYAAAFPLKRNY